MSAKRGGSAYGVLLFEFVTPCKVVCHACVLKPREARSVKPETEGASFFAHSDFDEANSFPYLDGKLCFYNFALGKSKAKEKRISKGFDVFFSKDSKLFVRAGKCP